MESVKDFITKLKILRDHPKKYNLSEEDIESINKVIEYAEKKNSIEDRVEILKVVLSTINLITDIVKGWF